MAARRLRQQRRSREHAELPAGVLAAAAEANRQRPSDRAAGQALGNSRDTGSSRGSDPAAGLQAHAGNAAAHRILAADMRNRGACLWATPCGRGCSVRANYQSATVHLPPALHSGNLDIRTDAMAYEITLGRDG